MRTYTIVDIHTSHNYNHQPVFCEDLDSLPIHTYRGHSIILGRDFNCVQSQTSSEAHIVRTCRADKSQLDIIGTHSLMDT